MSSLSMRLHNTLSGKVEEFSTLESHKVRMYNCGPTVYGPQHIGNLSMYVFTDILRRALESEEYKVKQVINFTDFGHLTGDNEGNADKGEDKMQRGLKREGLEPTLENMRVMAEKYAQIFLSDIEALNIDAKKITFPYASDYIPEQIKMIQTLVDKGFGYTGSQGVYFDTSKFPSYGKLGQINLSGQKAGARVEVASEKRNPTDFLLWKTSEKIGWESPWGRGFPGWHIECSAMIHSILGEQIDIHTGGIEHIGVHHQNEIAQSEAATGKSPFSRFWLHRAHIQMDGAKIAKSDGNVAYLSDITSRGFSPLSLRYLFLGAHYRTPLNFSWEGLESAQTAYRKLKDFISSLPKPGIFKRGKVSESYAKEFAAAMENDLNTPEALAVVWKLVKDDSIAPLDKRVTLLSFDKVLGLNLEENEFEVKDVPAEIKKLLDERETARKNKDFGRSDELRNKIKALGYEVKDTEEGQMLSR